MFVKIELLAISVALVAMTAEPAFAQNDEFPCAATGAYDGDPADFGKEAARGMVVRIHATFTETDQVKETHPSEGVGFVVGFKKKNKIIVAGGEPTVASAACSDREVQILTARHVVYEERTDRWASSIKVFVPGDDKGVDAAAIGGGVLQNGIDAAPYKLASPQHPPPSEYDTVVLHATVPTDFVWTGFRSTLSLRRGEVLHVPEFSQAGAVEFRDVTFNGIRLYPNMGIVVNGTFAPGDSGKPVFDKDWRIVGMFTTETGLVTPADSLRLILAGHSLATNLPTVGQLRVNRQQEERRDREDERRRIFEDTDGFTRFGAVRMSENFEFPKGPPMIGGRFGMSGGLPFSSYPKLALGLELMGGWQITGGYQEGIKGFMEVGAEVGVGAYFFKDRNVLLGGVWSPSILLLQGTSGEFVVALGSYAAIAQLGYLRLFTLKWYLGGEVRSVYPFGDRPSFVQNFLFLGFAHGSD